MHGAKEDPLNFVSRYALAMSFFALDRLHDAETEAKKVLEFDENHPWALTLLALIYAHQKKWEKARYCAEKASPSPGWTEGALAGILRQIGEKKLAEEIIHKPLQSKNAAMATYYYICGDIQKTKDWMIKVIEDRSPAAGQLALMFLGSSPQWPEIAKLMNLPE